MKTIKVIEEFEGSILEECLDEKGRLFLKKWCEPGVWVFVKTTKSRIKSYLKMKTNLRSLLFEFNEKCLVFNEKGSTYKEMYVRQLPLKYFPSEDSFYDQSLSPKLDN